MITKYNSQTNGNNKLVKIVKAESQVIAGVRYILELSVKATPSAKPHCVKAEIISRPWENYEDIKIQAC